MVPIVKCLGDQKEFLCGELTYIDFYCLELCELVQFLTENRFYEENKAMEQYVNRMKELPNLKKYIESDRYIEKPFHSKVALINNSD